MDADCEKWLGALPLGIVLGIVFMYFGFWAFVFAVVVSALLFGDRQG